MTELAQECLRIVSEEKLHSLFVSEVFQITDDNNIARGIGNQICLVLNRRNLPLPVAARYESSDRAQRWQHFSFRHYICLYDGYSGFIHSQEPWLNCGLPSNPNREAQYIKVSLNSIHRMHILHNHNVSSQGQGTLKDSQKRTIATNLVCELGRRLAGLNPASTLPQQQATDQEQREQKNRIIEGTSVFHTTHQTEVVVFGGDFNWDRPDWLGFFNTSNMFRSLCGAKNQNVHVCQSKTENPRHGDAAVVFNAYEVVDVDSTYGRSFGGFSDAHDAVLVTIVLPVEDPAAGIALSNNVKLKESVAAQHVKPPPAMQSSAMQKYSFKQTQRHLAESHHSNILRSVTTGGNWNLAARIERETTRWKNSNTLSNQHVDLPPETQHEQEQYADEYEQLPQYAVHHEYFGDQECDLAPTKQYEEQQVYRDDTQHEETWTRHREKQHEYQNDENLENPSASSLNARPDESVYGETIMNEDIEQDLKAKQSQLQKIIEEGKKAEADRAEQRAELQKASAAVATQQATLEERLKKLRAMPTAEKTQEAAEEPVIPQAIPAPQKMLEDTWAKLDDWMSQFQNAIHPPENAMMELDVGDLAAQQEKHTHPGDNQEQSDGDSQVTPLCGPHNDSEEGDEYRENQGDEYRDYTEEGDEYRENQGDKHAEQGDEHAKESDESDHEDSSHEDEDTLPDPRWWDFMAAAASVSANQQEELAKAIREVTDRFLHPENDAKGSFLWIDSEERWVRRLPRPALPPAKKFLDLLQVTERRWEKAIEQRWWTEWSEYHRWWTKWSRPSSLTEKEREEEMGRWQQEVQEWSLTPWKRRSNTRRRSAFGAYIMQLSGNKNLVHMLVQFPLRKCVNPVKWIRSFLRAESYIVNSTAYLEAREDSRVKTAEQRIAKTAADRCRNTYWEAYEIHQRVHSDRSAWYNLSDQEKELWESFHSGQLKREMEEAENAAYKSGNVPSYKSWNAPHSRRVAMRSWTALQMERDQVSQILEGPDEK